MTSSGYFPPKREILAPIDMKKWLKSQAYDDYMHFISLLSEAVKHKPSSEECTLSNAVQKMLNILDVIDQFITEIPPLDQPQRFGNKAYRSWHQRMVDESENLLKTLLPDNLITALVELQSYFTDSFGNSTRIDYGTGHEACFLMLLQCLRKLEVFTKDDLVAIINKIFERYLKVCRRLQQTYRMEPAGSHGVWCLDDFQFLPFYFGSAQLVDSSKIEPNNFVHEGFAEKYANDYMFMGCIAYINQVII